MALRFISTLLLINPTRHPGAVRRLQKLLKHVEGIDLVITDSKEDFLAQVQGFLASSYRYLLVYGGDGTAHDAINGLFGIDSTDRQSPGSTEVGKKGVGFLRGGTGNGIQDSYSVPYRLKQQLHAYSDSVRHDLTLAVDLLEVTDGERLRYGQLLGVGVDAKILKRRDELATVVRRGRTHVRSGFRYYLSSSFQFFFGSGFFDRQEFQLTFRNGRYAFRGPRVNAQFPFTTLDLVRAPLMVEIGTRPYYGKLFRVCPDVVCNDGYCDVYVFDFKNRRDLIGNVLYLWNGRHSRINRLRARSNRPVIERYQVDHLEVAARNPFHYHIDGELIDLNTPDVDGLFRLKVRILAQGIRFIVPREFYNIYHPFDLPEETHHSFFNGD